MRALVFALMGLIAAPVGAWAQWNTDPPAPQRYVQAPFKGLLYVWRVEPHDIWPMCRRLFDQHPDEGGAPSLLPPDELMGCSVRLRSFFVGFNTCKVIVGRGDDKTFSHEIAHCNGWHWTHPIDRWKLTLEGTAL